MHNGFRPAWWLPGPHLQTTWGRLARPRRLVAFEREPLATPDGDELLLDHLAGAPPEAGIHAILLHGLEGSSYSVYMQGLLAEMARRGWHATAVNFRSCARDPRDTRTMIPNRRPRLYHSGETTDFDFVARTLKARYPERTFVASGVSLGGNALLKWLGEHPGQSLIAAAATLSVPYDLGAGSRYMENLIGRLYLANFLSTLRPKAIEVAARFPEAAAKIDVERVRRSTTFWEYDDAVTGPLHGFAGADDYYTRSSSLGYAARITTPALCISAADDPFLPPEALERMRQAAAPCVELLVTEHGGHVGFIAHRGPWQPHYWAESRAVEWLAARV